MYDNGISINPAIMLGKPCIAGTRITVELILEKLAYGETLEQILEAYPHLTIKSIQDVFAFTAETLQDDIVYPARKNMLMVGKPFIVNTDIPASVLFNKLAKGETFEQIISEYPSLKVKAIRSAFAFAVRAIHYNWQTSEILHEIIR